MTRDQVTAVLARRRDALDSRDQKAFGEVYAESAELESPLAGTVHGREAVVRASWAFLSAFPQATFAYEAEIIDGDRAVVLAEVSGTDIGGILGHPPSGRAFRFPAAFVLTIKDDQIARERRIYDFTGLLIQIGALKVKPT